MALEVIGAGFGRTGTTSLKLALERLGFAPCHHMGEVMAHPEQLPHWQALVDGKPVDWEVVFQGYRASCDWPSAFFWRELAEAYPDAPVILSVRPIDSWWQSFSNTIMQLVKTVDEVPDPHIRATVAMGGTIVAERTFASAIDDEAAARAAFQRHIETVKAEIPPQRLLVFDVAEGWGPLCAFLGKPVPEEDFPRTNSTGEFWAMID